MLILAGCSSRVETPPEAYVRIEDSLLVRLHLNGLFGYPCTHQGTEDGIKVLVSLPYDQCYRFNPPERMDGIWHNEFEGSVLLTPAEAALESGGPHQEPRTWLFAEDAIRAHPPKSCDRDGCPPGDYRVVFIGRHTQYPGRYGHMGGFRTLVLMDRLISIEKVPDDWSAPTGSTAPRRP